MEKCNKGYETNHTAYDPVIICNCKQGRNSDHKICELGSRTHEE
jgi:hypothetical protein